ncbi:hypothetical protein NDU88_006765 [Pleurodeles waltl]|uniref:Uncharacterized protein n=1 Tax=Pleurodeles waltl TaxID=8319 RepID=A0AAV7SQU1_PLEWA|nr:hypothetical protein NDU88_006765 [Pleurodeles waltl]
MHFNSRRCLKPPRSLGWRQRRSGTQPAKSGPPSSASSHRPGPALVKVREQSVSIPLSSQLTGSAAAEAVPLGGDMSTAAHSVNLPAPAMCGRFMEPIQGSSLNVDAFLLPHILFSLLRT